MNKLFNILWRYFAFWMFFAILCRALFLAYFHEQLHLLSWAEILKIFAYGMRMDASMAAYISAIPAVVFIARIWIGQLQISYRLSRLYIWSVVIACSLISIINVNIYREWDTLISYKAVDLFLDSPRLAIASAASSPIFLSLFLLLSLSCVGIYLAKWMKIYQCTFVPVSKWYKKVFTSVGLLSVVFLLIRGGWGLTPLNPSMVYFATNAFPNHAATNVSWYFVNDMLHADGLRRNPYISMKNTAAKQAIAPLFTSTMDQSEAILNQSNPNVVLIILESFTADLVQSLGGEKGVAPNLEKLIAGGLLFDHLYASGDRTDKGMIAILSAFPTQSSKSIIKNIRKQSELPSLMKDFKERGYHTSFYYGGESEFYNFKGYMLSHGCKRIVDQLCFARREARSKWGVFDQATFHKQLQDLDQERQPFFSTLLTLNNHEPFDLPGGHRFGTDNLPNLFRSTAFYTDSVLYDYLQQAKTKAWYKNTLFIIVADHGHRLPLEQWESNCPNRYHIPLLFYGDVLRPAYRGRCIRKIGSQVDLAATICHQLGFPSNAYTWSRDLLNPSTIPFGFFSWSDGWGAVNAHEQVAFDNVGKVVSYQKNLDSYPHGKEDLLHQGKAYMQEVYNQYLAY
ncbi:sulfatase-like hydrolase/transferase [Olivibacter sp. CPCC 100613]|uniref:LTA synthase family protein n=1 Tax=Olivibacter sp. CPCC 100613 TaxID=3079931 RepID=UPI002FF7D3D9